VIVKGRGRNTRMGWRVRARRIENWRKLGKKERRAGYDRRACDLSLGDQGRDIMTLVVELRTVSPHAHQSC
jgi:hypothetical protein